MHTLNVMNSGTLHAAGGGRGVLIPGMPITIGNFALRALQFIFSIIAIFVMATASEFYKVTFFGYLIGAGVIQCVWSLVAVLLDVYTWSMGYALASPRALGRLAVLDLITFTLTFAAACGCAGVTTLLDNFLDKCNIIMCDRFETATAMMFLCSFTTLVSFTVNFWQSDLLIHDIAAENNQLQIRVPGIYGTWTSFILRIAECAMTAVPVWDMAHSNIFPPAYAFFLPIMFVRYTLSVALGIFDYIKISIPHTRRRTLEVILFIEGVITVLAFAATNAQFGFVFYEFHDLKPCVFRDFCWRKEFELICGYAVTIFGGIHVVASFIVLSSADLH